jgi:membrane protease YdiL (CAAX protease family)
LNPFSSTKAFIRNFSATTEFCLVLFIWIGLIVVSRIVAIAERLWQLPPPTMHLSDGDAVGLAVYESLRLGLILWIGRIRGWSLATFGLRPTWKWTGAGIVLFFAAGFTTRGMRLVTKEFFPTPLDSHIVSELTLPFIILISVINPIVEESLWGGYLTQTLQRYGKWVTVLASAFLRTFCHAHLGMMAFVSILPMGVIYGLVYWRWRQLWLLVVAHSLQMIFSLMSRIYVHPEEPGSQTRYEASWYLIGLAGVLLCGFMAWRNRENKRCANDAA